VAVDPPLKGSRTAAERRTEGIDTIPRKATGVAEMSIETNVRLYSDKVY